MLRSRCSMIPPAEPPFVCWSLSAPLLATLQPTARLARHQARRKRGEVSGECVGPGVVNCQLMISDENNVCQSTTRSFALDRARERQHPAAASHREPCPSTAAQFSGFRPLHIAEEDDRDAPVWLSKLKQGDTTLLIGAIFPLQPKTQAQCDAGDSTWGFGSGALTSAAIMDGCLLDGPEPLKSWAGRAQGPWCTPRRLWWVLLLLLLHEVEESARGAANRKASRRRWRLR
jgi:hypothetical protein